LISYALIDLAVRIALFGLVILLIAAARLLGVIVVVVVIVVVIVVIIVVVIIVVNTGSIDQSSCFLVSIDISVSASSPLAVFPISTLFVGTIERNFNIKYAKSAALVCCIRIEETEVIIETLGKVRFAISRIVRTTNLDVIGGNNNEVNAADSGICSLSCGLDSIKLGNDSGVLSSLDVTIVNGDCNAGQDGENGDDDDELYQSKALVRLEHLYHFLSKLIA